MKNVVLFCANGMSTGMLVNRMRDVAKEENIDLNINAYALAEVSRYIQDADIVLLGPQVRFELKKLRDSYPDKIIDAIEMTMYGMMDGKGVIDLIRQKLDI
jgi:PTS system cellobiose-specific IIB component